MKPTKITKFEVVHFDHSLGHSILLYALGEDGVIYELNGGKWTAFPIKEDFMRQSPGAGPGEGAAATVVRQAR